MTQSRRRHGIAMVFPSGAVQCNCKAMFPDMESARDHFGEINSAPATVHSAEQAWADASESLDTVIGYIRSQEAGLYRTAGGNTDPSVVFDFMKSYIYESEMAAPGDLGHLATVLFCAAAITRLVRADRANVSDALAQLDKDMESGNDDH